MKAIEFHNVSFSYETGEKKIVHNANFSVDFGEIALLSGFSGEGKSTILSLLTGIIPNVTPGQISGQIKICGESILHKKMNEICRKIGVVLQNAESQIIQQLVADEIAFGCENFAFPAKVITEQIRDACQTMKLNPNWKTRTLSGGQKQRLMTAATLATKQKILLLDEPLANLDKAGASFLMETLRRLAQAGYAILIVEHRLDLVLPFVDTVWRIQNGAIELVKDHAAYLSAQAGSIADTCIASPTDTPLLKLEQISFQTKDREILKNITMGIYQGERILLMGENGCGKTTLLRLIARLSSPSNGRILQYLDSSFGQKTKGNSSWFQRVGVVYQNPNYQLFMPTVQQEIQYGAESAAYGKEIMDLFDLSHLANRHPHALSEGQKRRVSIAAVAATKPDLLLLDEPTVGQDYAGLEKLVQVLNYLHEKNKNTMITVTHDMRCAEALCDRAVEIKQGIVAAQGGKEFVHNYFSAVPFPK